MKEKLLALNKNLKAVHRRFLENEKIEAEKLVEKQLSPFEFLLLLTSDTRFSWHKPFTHLLLDIDTLEDKKEITEQEVSDIRKRISDLLFAKDSLIAERAKHYSNHDGEFAIIHSRLSQDLT